jgi:hypothetical protein
MLGPDDEAKHLMATIIFALSVILDSNQAARQHPVLSHVSNNS